MKKVTLLKASFAFFIQFWLPFLGGGYLVIREYRKAIATALVFIFFIQTNHAQWPYIWGETWLIKTFETLYFSIWYITALHTFWLGLRKHKKSYPLNKRIPTKLESIC